MKKKILLVICVEFLEKTVTKFLYYKIDNGNATPLSFDWYLLFRQNAEIQMKMDKLKVNF